MSAKKSALASGAPALGSDVLAVARSGTDKKLTVSEIVGAVQRRNLVINGAFVVNQRGYTTGAAKAAGTFGHDRWKAGASGGVYSFTQRADGTTITLAGSNTLIQVIEDKQVEGGTYTLSWTGTAQARYAINSATPAGSYAASPITITGQTAGTTMSIEFNAGTLTNVMLNPGSIVVPFEPRIYSVEYELCRYYYRRISSNAGNNAYFATGGCNSTTAALVPCNLAANMRTTPTLGFSVVGDLGGFVNGGNVALTALAIAFAPESPLLNATVAAGFVVGQACVLSVAAGTGKFVDFSAEL